MQLKQAQEKAQFFEAMVHVLKRGYGVTVTSKLHFILKAPLQHAGIKLGRDALFDILRHERMLVLPKRSYHKTTNSHHGFRRHPNLLKEAATKVAPSGCEQLWVADITYLPTREKPAYLSLVTDAYSRKIVGWHVHEGLETAQVSQALKMALRYRQTSQRLVHHSDRGIVASSTVQQSTSASMLAMRSPAR